MHDFFAKDFINNGFEWNLDMNEKSNELIYEVRNLSKIYIMEWQ